MAIVNDSFAQALKARLNGDIDAASADTEGLCSIPKARQAKIANDVIAAASAETLEVPFAESLVKLPVSHEFLSSIPIAFARQHGLIGLAGKNGEITVAVSDPVKWPQVETVAKLLGKQVHLLFAPPEEIHRTINAAYQLQSGQAQQVIEQLNSEDVMREVEQIGRNEDLLDVASRAPVIRLVNLILFEAVKRRASDVHVQPYEDRLFVRFRLDGVLYDMFQPPKALQTEIISRIKVMGGMNIAERRLAQDGRATVEVGSRIVDLRIATLPTNFGERVVIRLLDKSARQYELTELGMSDGVLKNFRKLVHMDHGIILVTGPTGSGKSTTLYASLQEIDSKQRNILTLEDPIEYQLEGISQTQVSDRKGMTFASGLRHVLRQDPDVIMVGEIRDPETACMAIQSALTGHLVFSTLHTNDAAGSVTRMLDLGIEPYLLASCLLGSLAQRLIRRICPECKTRIEPTAADLHRWGVADGKIKELFKGTGCPSCMQTGYLERVGVFELLTVTELIRELILHRAKASSIKDSAISNGMITLRSSGIAKSIDGITTMDEVARVAGRDEF